MAVLAKTLPGGRWKCFSGVQRMKTTLPVRYRPYHLPKTSAVDPPGARGTGPAGLGHRPCVGANPDSPPGPLAGAFSYKVDALSETSTTRQSASGKPLAHGGVHGSVHPQTDVTLNTLADCAPVSASYRSSQPVHSADILTHLFADVVREGSAAVSPALGDRLPGFRTLSNVVSYPVNAGTERSATRLSALGVDWAPADTAPGVAAVTLDTCRWERCVFGHKAASPMPTDQSECNPVADILASELDHDGDFVVVDDDGDDAELIMPLVRTPPASDEASVGFVSWQRLQDCGSDTCKASTRSHTGGISLAAVFEELCCLELDADWTHCHPCRAPVIPLTRTAACNVDACTDDVLMSAPAKDDCLRVAPPAAQDAGTDSATDSNTCWSNITDPTLVKPPVDTATGNSLFAASPSPSNIGNRGTSSPKPVQFPSSPGGQSESGTSRRSLASGDHGDDFSRKRSLELLVDDTATWGDDADIYAGYAGDGSWNFEYDDVIDELCVSGPYAAAVKGGILKSDDSMDEVCTCGSDGDITLDLGGGGVQVGYRASSIHPQAGQVQPRAGKIQPRAGHVESWAVRVSSNRDAMLRLAVRFLTAPNLVLPQWFFTVLCPSQWT